jgi:uncharacterized protein (DUF58 family)
MRTREQDVEPLVNLSELTEIELIILKRMREVTAGEHRSLFHGSGFDFVGLRDWEPGDRASTVDWAQSSLTSFSPLVVRDFEQPSTGQVVVVADRSSSTLCGVNGVPIAKAIAGAIGTIGMSSVFFQDPFGLITFDVGFGRLAAVKPRVGKAQVVHCLNAYHRERGLIDIKPAESVSTALASFLRKTSLVPVISDCLFDNIGDVLRELELVNATHDVFLVLIDSAFAFEVPPVSAGWVRAFDVETGRSRLLSRRALRDLAGRMRTWQDTVERMAHDAGLDVLRYGINELASVIALNEFIAERRLRKA